MHPPITGLGELARGSQKTPRPTGGTEGTKGCRRQVLPLSSKSVQETRKPPVLPIGRMALSWDQYLE